jgi:hypothetical protein
MAKPKQKLGTLVDKLWLKREEIRREEAKVKKLKEDYNKQVDLVMDSYDKGAVEKAAGSLGQASLSHRAIYRVADPHVFLEAIRKGKKFWPLLKPGLDTEAFGEFIEENPPKNPQLPFPGVELFTDVRLHLTAVKKGKRK